MKKTKKYTEVKATHSRLPLSRIVLIFSAIILLLNVVVVVKRGIDSRETALAEGMVAQEQLTHTVAEHIELTFSSADVTLKRALERQYFNALFGNRLVADMHSHFIEWGKETPQMAVMLMADETGKITVIHRKVGYKTWLQDRESVAIETFFVAHEQSDDSDLLYIGEYENWIKGSDGFVVLSRRLNKIDGSFGGVVLVAVSRAYISNFFHSVALSEHHNLAVTKGETMLLSSGFDAQVDRTAFEGYREHLEQRSVINTSIYPEENGEDARVYSSLQIPNFGLLVTVTNRAKNLLSGWRTEQMSDFIFLAVFVLFVVVISFFVTAVTKQMHRVQRSEQAAILASQAKSDFLANMSHELRTPLNAIIGFSEMIAQGYFGKLNNRQEERVGDINSCGTHLLSLINDVLEFSKGEAGKIELLDEEVDIAEVIGEVERMLTEKAAHDGVNLVVTVSDAVGLLRADKRKMKQILLNLTSNAVKFTPEKGTVEITCDLDAEGCPLIVVTDTGAGMKEADIPKALSAFGQVHDDPAKGGTGLGLPLCKMFAELHGGTLAMQSVEGVGTRVTVRLPKERVVG